MADLQTAWWLGLFGAVGAGLMTGAMSGLIPLLFGEYSDQRSLGRKAFLFSVLAGLILGIVAALPVALGFTVAIVWEKRARRRREGVQT